MANTSGVTVDTSLSTNPSNSSITLVNVGSNGMNGLVTSDTLSFGTGNTIAFGAATGSGAASGVYDGTSSGVAATPFQNTRNYYAAEPGTGVTFTYGATQHYFGIEWGSVDTYNTLTFYNGSTVIYTLTGGQVTSSANGSQGSSGTDYVNINFSQLGFTSVVASSTSAAFEFASIASSPTTVPVTSGQTGKPTTVTPTDTKTGQPVCFLRGTRVMTVGGEVAIEDLYDRYRNDELRGDDRAVTALDGAPATLSIRWMGRRHIGRREVERGGDYPVRVRQDAVAAGIPCRDLLVTPEHCLFVDGRLIPARMLVNDRSIILDRGIAEFEIYHLELERHSILLAERMTVESYLDTGNRNSFADQPVVALRPTFDGTAAELSWEHDACAPLTTDRATVEPIWDRLAARADAMNRPATRSTTTVRTDLDLRVLLDDGRLIGPEEAPARRTFFRIPTGLQALGLVSHTTSPAEAIGPFVDDRRRLGIRIDALVFWNGLDEHRIPASDLTGPGWYGLEDGSRWMDGKVVLDLPAASDRPCFLEIGVVDGLAAPLRQGALQVA